MSELKFGEKCLVWNGTTKPKERIYLGYAQGFHWAVDTAQESAYKDGTRIYGCPWKHAEPLPEKLEVRFLAWTEGYRKTVHSIDKKITQAQVDRIKAILEE